MGLSDARRSTPLVQHAATERLPSGGLRVDRDGEDEQAPHPGVPGRIWHHRKHIDAGESCRGQGQGFTEGESSRHLGCEKEVADRERLPGAPFASSMLTAMKSGWLLPDFALRFPLTAVTVHFSMSLLGEVWT